MKKLLTLTALVAGVALFAGCMNQPVVEDETMDTTPVVEEVTTEEVVPAEDTTTTDEATTTEEATTEVAPEATAE